MAVQVNCCATLVNTHIVLTGLVTMLKDGSSSLVCFPPEHLNMVNMMVHNLDRVCIRLVRGGM